MKRKIIAGLLAMTMTLSLAACGGSDAEIETAAGTPAQEALKDGAMTEEPAADPSNGGLADGRFAETRKITVEIYDRGNDGGSDPANNKYTDYIKKGMMDKYNVEVEYTAVPRWTEAVQIDNLLAAGDAPDICLTYDYSTIQAYADMGGILDLSGYVEDYKEILPNLWAWLGETNIYWNKDPEEGTVWAIESKLATSSRINTFIRKDWLDTLGLSVPTTKAEFEEVLIAFRDNADTLLGVDADNIIPYSVSCDVGWRAATLIESFIDPAISDREYYVNGFDDRKLTQNGTKEAVRLLNKWYNDGLMWDDFALYGSGDTTEDDMMKAGYVGAFTHDWDYPYRNGEDSIQANLQRLVGEDAYYIVCDPFEDSKGTHTKYTSGTADGRMIFFPATNDEPLASMLFLDFISTPEVIQYLQIGDEGVNHKLLDDGAYEIIAAAGNDIQNSDLNVDYTITCNGMNLADPEVTAKSVLHSYEGIDPALIEEAEKAAQTDAVPPKNVNIGAISAEEGMGAVLSEKRDIVYETSMCAPVEQFDFIWDVGMQDYLNSGGQAVMDERSEKWAAVFGDTDFLPQ